MMAETAAPITGTPVDVSPQRDARGGRPWLWRLLLSLVVTALFGALLVAQDLMAPLKPVLAAADAPHLLGALAAIVATHVIRAWRLALWLEPDGSRLTRRAFVVSTWHSFWIAILPARAGEVSFIVMALRRYHKTLAEAVGLLLMLRLLDLLVVCAFGGMAAWMVLAEHETLARLAAPLGAGGLAAGFGFLLLLGFCHLARGFLPALPARGRVLQWVRQALAAAIALSPRRLVLIWCASVALWVSQILALYQCLLAVVATVPLAVGVLAGTAGIMSFALPINGVASIGPFEAAWTAAGTAGGIATSDALAAAILAHALLLVVTVLMLVPATLLRRERRGD